MEVVDVIHVEVRHVTVIAQFSRGGNVRASAEHERDLTRTTEPPVAGLDIVHDTSENVAIPSTGLVEVVDGENGVGTHDLHADKFAAPEKPWIDQDG